MPNNTKLVVILEIDIHHRRMITLQVSYKYIIILFFMNYIDIKNKKEEPDSLINFVFFWVPLIEYIYFESLFIIILFVLYRDDISVTTRSHAARSNPINLSIEIWLLIRTESEFIYLFICIFFLQSTNNKW